MQVDIAYRIGLMKIDEYKRMSRKIEDVERMLNGLMSSIERELAEATRTKL